MKIHLLFLLIKSVIFLSYIISTVHALNTCPDTATSIDLNKYCIKDKKILKGKSTTTNGETSYSFEPVTDGVYLFKKDEGIINNVSDDISEGYLCTNTECSIISTNGVYINSQNEKHIAIYDNGFNKCIKGSGTYLNKISSNNLVNALIKCDGSSNCEIVDANEGVYINNAGNGLNKALIKCENSNCFISDACKNVNYEYFVDSNPYDNNSKISGIIICSKKNGKCERKKSESPEGYYLNYGSDSGEKPLILCEAGDNVSCKSVTSSSLSNIYYINAGESSTLIKCSGTTNCELFTSPKGNYFYVNAIPNANGDDALIFCDDGKCNLENISGAGYYLTYSDTEGLIVCEEPTSEIKIICSVNTPSTFTGYYLNSDPSTKDNKPLIKCTNIGCKLLTIETDISPGFYVNAGTQNSIITCDDKKCEISNVYTSKDVNGSYNYDGKDLKIYVDTNEDEDERLSQSSNDIDDSEALYYYINVPNSNIFPGITSSTTTLFKVSKYSITRLIVNSNFAIENTTNKVTESGTINSDITLYTCSYKTKICTKSNTCKSNIYLLDKNNKIAYYCNDKNVLSKITEEGYYLDSSLSTTNSVINCKNSSDGIVCEYVSNPKYYFINSGYNKATHPLIQCQESLCHTTNAVIGNYLSGVIKNDVRGIIKCTSSNDCSEMSSVKSNDHYFINNGYDKNVMALINCYNKNCFTIRATVGNYISDEASILINCESSSNCNKIAASSGFYSYSSNNNGNDSVKKIIECELKNSIVCEPKDANSGFYLSNISNVLINCTGNDNKCTTIIARNGIYRSATTRITSSSKRDDQEDNDKEEKQEENGLRVKHNERANKLVYNIIVCSATSCNELSASELAAIPYCTFDNNKCFISNKLSANNNISVSSISSGSYCTNSDREVLYFATDTIVPEKDSLYGSTSIYTYTTTNSNCIKVSSAYANNYFTIRNNIYHIDEGQISQIVNAGYYFINVNTNTLVNGNNIEDYNDPDVKLFKCNDNSCSFVNKPETTTYIADVNKKIIKYNPNSDSYVFPYENDIICMYSNNKCIPKYDLKDREFCITYKGELVLAGSNILSHETGDCYKSSGINSAIYGYSQYLYEMTTNYAQIIDETAYYIVSLSTNTTASFKDYTNRNNPIKIYGCVGSQCKETEPSEEVYYYSPESKYLFMYEKGQWTSPKSSGYALISITPNEEYIYKYTLNSNTNKVTINEKAKDGYYYTPNNEMYKCDENNNICTKVDNSGYYFTNNGEMYYCLHDSEGLEKISCTKKSCIIGQFYYINEKYYRCEIGSMFKVVSSKYCKYDENVIINFITSYYEEYPNQIKLAIENVATNNNSTAIVQGMNNNYMNVVPGIFTNCTYNPEDKSSSFDLVCINNYVSYNEENDNLEICSIPQLGYVECIEDEDNPNKCKISGSLSRYSKSIFTIIMSIAIIIFILI